MLLLWRFIRLWYFSGVLSSLGSVTVCTTSFSKTLPTVPVPKKNKVDMVIRFSFVMVQCRDALYSILFLKAVCKAATVCPARKGQKNDSGRAMINSLASMHFPPYRFF